MKVEMPWSKIAGVAITICVLHAETSGRHYLHIPIEQPAGPPTVNAIELYVASYTSISTEGLSLPLPRIDSGSHLV